MELVLVWLFFYLPLCIAVAMLASRYRRFALGWFLVSVLLSPLLGFVFVLAVGPKERRAPVQRTSSVCKREPERAELLSRVPAHARARLANEMRGAWS